MKNKRIPALLLGLIILLALVPFSALAEEASTGLCPHHPEHTAECGYEAVEGTPCTHEHDSSCGYAAEVPCDKGCTASADGIIVHAADCAYRAAVSCTHTHDDSCGYTPTRVITPCGYECAACAADSAGGDTGDDTGTTPADPADDGSATATDVTEADTAWSDGRFLAGGTVTIPSRVTVSGNVTLVLAEDAVLTVSGGIQVPTDASLTICSQGSRTGSLIATGTEGAAGIGGGAGQACGSVTVYSGSVNATGGAGAPGIGGGRGCEGGSAALTIAGGSVTATGRDVSGIGGGKGTAVVSGGIVRTDFSDGWTLSTGEGRSAVIFGTIGDQSKKADWNAVIFTGDAGQVYGQAAPGVSFTIPAGATLTVPEGAGLTVPDGITVTNKGRLLVVGSLSGASSVSGKVYYRVACAAADNGTAVISANGVTAASAYAVAGARINVVLTPASGYKTGSASAASGGTALTVTTTDTGISFTMPAGAVKVSASFQKIDAGTQPDDPGSSSGGDPSGGSSSGGSSSGGSSSGGSSSGRPSSGRPSSGSSSGGNSGGAGIAGSGSSASAPAYTVTIPAGVSLGETVTIRAEDVSIGSSKALTVTLDKSANDFSVVNDDGDALRYSVKSSSGAALGTGSTVLSMKKAGSDQASLTFSEPLDTPVYAGTYTDTLTFFIAVK